MTTLVTNIRHDIDLILVQTAVASKIAHYEDIRVRLIGESIALLAKYEQSVANGTAYKDWHRKPQDAQSVTTMVDNWIEREREYYSTVRVVESPTGEKRFLLVYGDENDATVTSTGGTGPFSTYDAAVKWFTRGGR
jgi:hypothetical protein